MTDQPQTPETLIQQEQSIPVFSLEDEAKLEIIHALEPADPMSWGATPLHPYLEPVREQQISVEETMDRMFTEDLPEWMPPELAEDIHGFYQSRREHRRIRNFESFKHRGVADLHSGPDELIKMADRAMSGHASPAEIHLVGKYYKIPTRELGCVSVPFGKRMDDADNVLDKLRAAVDECVVIHKGKFLNSPPVFQIGGYAQTEIIKNGNRDIIPRLRMTRTFDRATIDESCLILERSSFDVRIDKLFAFNPEIAAQLMRLYHSGKPVSEKEVLEIEGFVETVTQLLDTNKFEIATPVSVTVFEVDVDLCEQYLYNDVHKKAVLRRTTLGENGVDGATLRRMFFEAHRSDLEALDR